MGGEFQTWLSGVEAARHGISPDTLAMQGQLQHAQLASAYQQPGVRELASANPTFAKQIGLPVVDALGGAPTPDGGFRGTLAERVLQQRGGFSPGSPIVGLPPEDPLAKLKALILQAQLGEHLAKANWLNAGTGDVTGAKPATTPAPPLETGAAAAPGGRLDLVSPGGPSTPLSVAGRGLLPTASAALAPSPDATAAPAGRGLGNYVLTGRSASGPTYSLREPQVFQPGTQGPSGLVLPGDKTGSKEAYIAPNTADIEAQKVYAKSANEVLSNIRQVEKYFKDPQFEAAVASSLPANPGRGLMAGARGRAAESMNTVGQYLKGATSDPDIKYLEGASRTAIPLLRTDAMGTAGLRLNQSLIDRFSAQADHLASGRFTQESARAYRDNVLEFTRGIRQEVAARGAALKKAGTSAPTPASSTTTAPGTVPLADWLSTNPD